MNGVKYKWFYEGDEGAERLVRKEGDDGHKWFYDGEKGAERLMRGEYANGDRVLFGNAAPAGILVMWELYKENTVSRVDYNWSDLLLRKGIYVWDMPEIGPYPWDRVPHPWAETQFVDDDLPEYQREKALEFHTPITSDKRLNAISVKVDEGTNQVHQVVTFEGGKQVEFETRMFRRMGIRFVPAGERLGLLEAVKINGQELFRYHMGPLEVFYHGREALLARWNSDRPGRLRWRYANGEYLDDEEIVFAAVKQDGMTVASIVSDPDLAAYIENKRLMKEAVKQNGEALRILPQKYERNPSFRLGAAASSLYYAKTVLEDMKQDLLKYKESNLQQFILAFKRSAFGRFFFTKDYELDAYLAYGDAASELAGHWATPTRRKLNMSLDDIELYNEIQRLAEGILEITENPRGIGAQELKRRYEEDMLANRDGQRQRTGAMAGRTRFTSHWDHSLLDEM